MTEAAALEAHRRALIGIGYRMLGSVADAEDVAQEALLRLHQADPPPDNPRAWLVRVATRLALDRLRSAQHRKETYVGPWLPEFLVGEAPDPADDLARAESLSLALLVVLESLSPAERAAFVLHDVFGFGYDELAETLERGEPACRQLVSRARRQLQERRPRYEPDRAERERVAYAFFAAAQTGEMEPLMAVLSEDVVLRADAGGRMTAPRRSLHGPREVAKFMLGVGRKGGAGATYEPLEVNGSPGFLVSIDGRPDTIVGLDVADGRIVALHFLREPDKVARTLAAKLPR